MRYISLIAALALALTAATAHAASKSQAEKAIAAASAAVKKAGQTGHEWRFSQKFIKKAKAAAEKGDYDKALMLANKAKSEGELAAAQAKAEKDAGIPAYVHEEVKGK